jgi:hypothetical protein
MMQGYSQFMKVIINNSWEDSLISQWCIQLRFLHTTAQNQDVI